MSKIAIYPGSFDPITYGHLDLIKRATHIFDTVIVAVAEDTQKRTLFSTQERVDLIRRACKGIKGVVVEDFSGLVVEFAKKKKTNVLVRGLRMISDFEFELQMALTNRRLAQSIETIFLMPSEGFSFTSSTLLKEAAALGADLSSFVPDFVAKSLKEKLSKGKKK